MFKAYFSYFIYKFLQLRSDYEDILNGERGPIILFRNGVSVSIDIHNKRGKYHTRVNIRIHIYYIAYKNIVHLLYAKEIQFTWYLIV